MNWRNYFSPTILERGRRYYKRNLVNNIVKKDNKYHAQVIGSRPYKVSLWQRPNRMLGMSCNCPYAKEGNKCKHMAALCMALDEELTYGTSFIDSTVQQGTADKRVYPFPVKNRPDQKEYTYFDLSVITKDFKIMESQLSIAKEMVDAGKVVLKEVEVQHQKYFYQDNYCMQGTAIGYYKNSHGEALIYIHFDAEKITRATCAVQGCKNNYEPRSYYASDTICTHQLALLLLLKDYIDKYNPGDNTDYDALRLMDEYKAKHRKQVVGNVSDIVEDLQLEPKLERKENGLALSFRAGTGKLYVVKDLPEFVRNVEEGNIQLFGKKTELNFSIHKINASSKQYFDFLCKIVKDEKLRHKLKDRPWSYPTVKPITAYVELYGRRLDEFFQIMLDNKQGIAYQDYTVADKKAAIRARKYTPHIKLEINPTYAKNNVFIGVCVTGELPEILEGEKGRYYLEYPYINRLDLQAAELLSPLFDMAHYGEIKFVVGRKSLSDFYYHFLPALGEWVEFIERGKEMVEEYLPPKAEFRFYMDLDGSRISCDAKVFYGEEMFSLVDMMADEPVNLGMRDREAEAEALFHVARYFSDFDAERGIFLCDEEEEAAYAVLEQGITELMGVGEVFCTERLKRIRVRKKTPVNVGVTLESGIMNLDIFSDEFSKEELLEILASYRKRKKYHRLRDGDFLNVEDDNLGMLADMMDLLHVHDKEFLKGNIKIPTYRALYLDTVLEKNESLYVERDKNFKSLIKEFKTVSDSDFEVPMSLQKVLRNYQNVGYKWLRTLETYGFGGILADDMGLGKTLQVISVLLAAKLEHKLETALIVTPASLIYNWQEEFKRFAPDIQAFVVSGNQKSRIDVLKDYKKYDVLITSYDLLKRDIAEYEDKEFSFQILDEAQYIKNHTTAVAKSVKCINSRTRYALTGTPIENRLSELWSIFDYLMPGFLYGYETFRKELERPITKNQEEEASRRLKRMVSPFILRRLKQDVLKDLPDKLEEIHYGGFEEKQQKIYDGQVLHMREMIERQSGEDFSKNKIQILAELTKLRQICCDPALLFENYDGNSAKRQMCIELIKRAMDGGHRILLFSQFTSMLALLEGELKTESIEYYKITGSTSKEERLSFVKAFNEGCVPVFLISLKAGGTGLNLTGADMVIHYDPWWNLAVQNQATDRAHRIGQKKVVTVYKLIMKGTIEEKIVKLQEKKKNLADEILSGEHGGLAKLSKEELLELL